MAGDTGGGPGNEPQPINGRIIDPIALERRLSQIEGRIVQLDQKVEQWTKSHEAWGISQNMQQMARLDALQQAIGELQTSNAVCGNRWDNHVGEHIKLDKYRESHQKLHSDIGKKDRLSDVIVGVVSSAVGIIAAIVRP